MRGGAEAVERKQRDNECGEESTAEKKNGLRKGQLEQDPLI